MLKLLAVIIAAGLVSGFVPAAAQAANEPDKAAVQKATADCRAEVKEQARFHEMSWYARHKLFLDGLAPRYQFPFASNRCAPNE